jgi:glycerate kinase
MKRFIVIPDSFKGTYSSQEIASFMKEGILSCIPDAFVEMIPIADGGEGSVDCYLHALGGTRITLPSKDPFMRDIYASFGLLPNQEAIIELAATSGLSLVKDNPNPSIASTYGVGIQILQAIEHGAKHIILAIGGSASNDAGVGLLQALGYEFYNEFHQLFFPTGATLGQISYISSENVSSLLQDIKFTTLCDVKNPLFGPQGAAYVYSPQKGASPDMVKELDQQLRLFANYLTKNGYQDPTFEGSGAAGGSSVALKLFLHSSIVRGIDFFLEITRFRNQLEHVDMVFTGEGQMDSQSFSGKVIDGIASKTFEVGVPLIAFVGRINGVSTVDYPKGLNQAISISQEPFDLQYVISHTKELLIKAINSFLYNQ